MQMNQMTGAPIDFGFSMGPNSNFLNSVSSDPANCTISSNMCTISSSQSTQNSNHIGRKILSNIEIRYTSDVIKTLQQHPAYMQIPPSEIEAVAAAILSFGCAAGGVALFALSGGTTGPVSIALASIALTSAGTTGAAKAIQGAIQGNFSWQEWSRDVLISAGTSLITFGASYTVAGGLAYLCLNHSSIALSSRAIESIAQVGGSFAGATARGSSYYIIKQCSQEKIETFDLILEIASGALAGAAVGKIAANTQLTRMIRGSVMGHKTYGKGFYKEGVIFNKSNKTMTVFTTKGEIIGNDIYLISQKVKCATPINGKVLVLSGSHGDKNGSTVLENIRFASQDFFERDRTRLIPDALQFRDRTVSILNLTDFREQGSLHQALVNARPDVIITNFCHGDAAIEQGMLGQIINQAFLEMV